MKKLEGRQRKKTLEDGTSNDRFSKIFSISKPEQSGAGKRYADSIEPLFREDRKSARPFQDNNNVPKKKKTQSKKSTAKSNYSSTKVKARNLLTNVSYGRYKQKGFNNASFIIDILSFIVQNFTPINLDWKLDDEKEKKQKKYKYG